jgi:hypothetical protein
MEIVKSNDNNKWYKQIIKNIYKQITIIINVIKCQNISMYVIFVIIMKDIIN